MISSHSYEKLTFCINILYTNLVYTLPHWISLAGTWNILIGFSWKVYKWNSDKRMHASNEKHQINSFLIISQTYVVECTPNFNVERRYCTSVVSLIRRSSNLSQGLLSVKVASCIENENQKLQWNHGQTPYVLIK